MLPGEVLTGRFEVLRGAGSGGMGVVYQAKDLETGEHVALKLLLGGEEAMAARFAQEVALLSELDHPHIVGYVSHGLTSDGAPYLVMPWLEGQDLQERVRERPLSVDETLTVAHRVADALAYLHRRGLVHRDLKPSNFFLPAGQLEDIKLIDLGIARATVPSRPLTSSGVLLGTPGFIAPEQAYGAHGIAPAADIFALGCVLFECLTGRRLFSGQHVMAVLAKILLEEAPHVRELCPEVPEGLERLIDRMVSKEPELRPQDGAELQQCLRELERGVPLSGGRALSPESLTGIEQRVASVLVSVLTPARASISPVSEVTRAEVNPLQAHSSRFGVEIHALAEGVALALAPEELSAADGAALLARFGMFVLQNYPGAQVALATGSAVTGSGARVPVGLAIDRAVGMVRGATRSEQIGVEIDEISAALVAARFDVQPEGQRLLLVSERLSLDPSRPLLGRPTSCVGRDRELTILDATFAECQESGGPKVVLITAASGVGKSRLRHEFARRRAADTVTLLHCHGDPLHLTTPYAQIAQVIRHLAQLHDGHDSKDVRERFRQWATALLPAQSVSRVVDFLGEIMGASFDEEHLPLRAARQNETAMADNVMQAFVDVFRVVCASGPVVLIMEDLHWCDALSVKTLDTVLRKMVGTPLMVLALARPEVHERFPRLWSNRHVTEIRLPPLSPQASTKLVHEVMGSLASEDDVVRIVYRSEGNAFYLEELIRAAAERARRHSSLPPPLQQRGLPETIIAAAQARLERLEPEVRKVLRAASIFGETFWLQGVCALLAREEEHIGPLLDVLAEHEVIAPSVESRLTGARELTFRHALLRGAVYATLTEEDRQLGHRLAATWLDEADEDREVVALHWLEGGDRLRAARAFTEAGETRLARAQFDAAARCAVRALLVADEGVDTDTVLTRLRVLSDGLEVARAIDAREVMSGLEAHVRLPDDAQGSQAKRTVVHVAVERALASVGGDAGPAMAQAYSRAACSVAALWDFSAAKTLLAAATGAVSEHEASARTLRYAAAKIAFWQGEWVAAVEILSTTLLPTPTRERVTMLLLLATAVVSVDGREAFPRGLEYVSRAEVLVQANGDDPVAQLNCCKARLICFYFAGEYQRVADVAEEGMTLARQAGLRYEEGLHLHNHGDAMTRLGSLDRARASLLASNLIAHDLGSDPLARQNDFILAYLDSDDDRLEQFVAVAHAAGKAWEEINACYWLARLLSNRRNARARSVYGRALALARELGVHSMADECASALAALPPERITAAPRA